MLQKKTQPDAKGDTVTITFLFAFFRREPKISLTNIKGILFKDREVKVLGYSGSYVYVKDTKTQDEGYIHSFLLDDNPLNIKQEYIAVYCDASKEGAITINYNKDGVLEWYVNQSGIVEVTKHNDKSLSVKGLSPGIFLPLAREQVVIMKNPVW